MRATRARRKKNTFRKQSGVNPWVGFLNNRCMCRSCGRGL